MPLTLILGPANSAKAGEVLGAYAAAVSRGALLVVPTALDAEHYARELAGEGALLGTVLTFAGLAEEIARRAGFRALRATELQRRRLMHRAVADAGLTRLGEAARSPGFERAAGALIAELQRSLITPARFASALRTWAAGDEARGVYAREVAGLYFAYRRALERAGRVDGELFAWQALDALRRAPARWGASPVFFYGFDDLDPLQRDAIETLGTVAGAEVTASLTYEAGRVALGARAEAVAELRPLAERVREMPAVDDYYAPAARATLHHLERELFEPAPLRLGAGGPGGVADGESVAAIGAGGPGTVAGGDAVCLLEAGGERAEAELVAAEILALLGAGTPAEEIAVVLRSPEEGAAALIRVFSQYGVPFSLRTAVPLGHTALGRGLLALARCALSDASHTPATALVDYLRTPGAGQPEAVADELEARIRRLGLRSLDQVRTGVAADLPELRALREAPDPAREIAVQARRLLAAPAAGRGTRLSPAGELDARACAAVLDALAELREIEPEIAAADLVEVLEAVLVPAGALPRPAAVLITDPLSIRARRFSAVIVCGLQEGRFPRPGTPEPFLSDETRRELAALSGLRLRPREDALARERYLFYACISRATERLVLSYCSSDEEGNLALPSPFLRDVAELLDEGWWKRRRRRLLADVVWAPEQAPTTRELELARADAAARGAALPAAPGARSTGAAALEPPTRRLSERALPHVRHHDVVSAGALELFADCPVKWLVERQLDPQTLEPTPEPLARGSFMHDTLERVLRALDAAVSPASLPRALELLSDHLTELPAELAAGRPPGVRAATLRAIEAELRRYLEHEARVSGGWGPARLEQRFGFEDDEASLPALELAAGGQRIRVRGAIDRIDVDAAGRRAIVRDYKSGAVRPEFQGARWSIDRRLQVALYMLAVRELLGLEPVAGLYQPLRGGDLRARGAFLADAGVGEGLLATDGCTPEQLDALLEDARARALALAARLRAGELAPCPSTCSRDGCRHPEICRSP